MTPNYENMPYEHFRYYSILAYLCLKSDKPLTSKGIDAATELWKVDVDPITNQNFTIKVLSEGFSVMCRQYPPNVSEGYYWHVQRGPEEPENNTFSTHFNLSHAVCLSLVKSMWDSVDKLPVLPKEVLTAEV